MDFRKSTLYVLLLFALGPVIGAGAQEMPAAQTPDQTNPAAKTLAYPPGETAQGINESPAGKDSQTIDLDSSENAQIAPDQKEGAEQVDQLSDLFSDLSEGDQDEQTGADVGGPELIRKKNSHIKAAETTDSEAGETKKAAPKPSSTKKSVKKWVSKNGWRVALIVIFAVIALVATNSFSKFLLKSFTKDREGTEIQKRARTLSSVIRYGLMAVIALIAGLMILKELDLDIGPILAGAGVIGIAIGFGAQNLVKDVIAGFFILMEDQIRVGDVVTLADKTGYVEKVTLRMVVLRDVAGNVHYVPSGEITMVTNKTKTFSRYLFEISVAYKEDIDEVIDVMKKVDEDLRSDTAFSELILAPIEVMGLDRFDSSGMIIKARTKTRPNKQWKVGREYNRRLKKKFDEIGIEIPFPHLTLYPGETKTGAGPPFHVVWQQKEAKSADSAE